MEVYFNPGSRTRFEEFSKSAHFWQCWDWVKARLENTSIVSDSYSAIVVGQFVISSLNGTVNFIVEDNNNNLVFTSNVDAHYDRSFG